LVEGFASRLCRALLRPYGMLLKLMCLTHAEGSKWKDTTNRSSSLSDCTNPSTCLFGGRWPGLWWKKEGLWMVHWLLHAAGPTAACVVSLRYLAYERDGTAKSRASI